jgi:formylglycine-generating enzyme required for sulfatase activity
MKMIGRFSPILSAFCLCAFGLSAQSREMIYVEGGDFVTSTGQSVQIASFYIDPYEVTIGDFARFVEATGYVTQAEKDKSTSLMGDEKGEGVNWRFDMWGRPVAPSAYDETPLSYVSYADMLVYCEWAGKRLIREEEWEYAFREGAKNSTFKYSGSNQGKRVAVMEDFDSVTTTRIGQKAPNALGIYDMSGNQNEICVVDDNRIIIRGGNFVDDASMATVQRAGRPLMPIAEVGNDHTWYFGFRCVK